MADKKRNPDREKLSSKCYFPFSVPKRRAAPSQTELVIQKISHLREPVVVPVQNERAGISLFTILLKTS